MTDKHQNYTTLNRFLESVKGDWEGYIWMSNERKPFLIPEDKSIDDLNDIGVNPFVIEGLLYDKAQKISVTIRHTGTYHIDCFDLKALNNDGNVLKEEAYLSHGFPDKRKLKFNQLWIPEPDENCAGMKVLTMKALLFTGFAANNQQNK